eukprot:1142008-Pelagomonas_calceolata.AAC.1
MGFRVKLFRNGRLVCGVEHFKDGPRPGTANSICGYNYMFLERSGLTNRSGWQCAKPQSDQCAGASPCVRPSLTANYPTFPPAQCSQQCRPESAVQTWCNFVQYPWAESHAERGMAVAQGALTEMAQWALSRLL